MARAETNVSREDFIRAWEECAADGSGVKGVAERTGLKPTSIQARASKYRADYKIPLTHMQRGGGSRVDVDAALQLLADCRGVSVETIKAEQTEMKAKQAERKAAREATKEAEGEATPASE